ncbi:hypothetical protein Tco_0948103 [Tanacetum coccineum]
MLSDLPLLKWSLLQLFSLGILDELPHLFFLLLPEWHWKPMLPVPRPSYIQVELSCSNVNNALIYSTFHCYPDLGVLQIGIRAKVIENQGLLGADEEISDEGSLRVIVYGYDGLPMQLVAPPSPDYIRGLEDPQIPPVPHDEDEREPMFIQPQDPDYVPEPIYPEYIPLEDEHVFPVEEQPLPPVDSPTAKSPVYVAESDPEEDPEEYEDDETEDGPVDYPMDVGDDGDDDDSDSSGDDADDEDEDEITVRLQASISLPPEEEVERLLGMTTLSPSPPISLSPPFAGERLARCPTQIQTRRITSTQALIDVVTATLPSPSLPPLPPSLYIPPPVDHRDDVPESELSPRKRLCLSTLGSRYEIRESSIAKPTGGQGIDYGFVSTVDAEARQQGIDEVGYGFRDTWVDPTEAVPEIAPMTVGEVNTRVTELAELHERDT